MYHNFSSKCLNSILLSNDKFSINLVSLNAAFIIIIIIIIYNWLQAHIQTWIEAPILHFFSFFDLFHSDIHHNTNKKIHYFHFITT